MKGSRIIIMQYVNLDSMLNIFIEKSGNSSTTNAEISCRIVLP